MVTILFVVKKIVPTIHVYIIDAYFHLRVKYRDEWVFVW
jgi:hypothetical protein